MSYRAILSSFIVLMLMGLVLIFWPHKPADWQPQELVLIESLWLENLEPLPPAPDNAVADDSLAAALGELLFSDTRFSGNGEVACASCHQPEKHFTDSLPQGMAIGRVQRNTMSLIGSAWSPWLYWDGRRDSLWSQALAPLEAAEEHGGDRMYYARLLLSLDEYREGYRQLFGSVPDFSDTSRFPRHASPLADKAARLAWQEMSRADRCVVNRVFSNLGKLLAAYERTLVPKMTRFDRYVNNLKQGKDADFSDEEIRGLRLFIGKGRCMECHNGPLFSNNEFHNTGLLSYPGELPDVGRSQGLRDVLQDPFNCRGAFNDADNRQCPELDFVRSGIELLGAFRTPSLRNLEGTAPYMHKGQLQTLREVLQHYNRAPEAMIGHNEAEPLGLSRRQLRDLEAFLLSLRP